MYPPIVPVESRHEEELSCPTLPRWEISISAAVLPSRRLLIDVLCIALNTISTVLITFLNKTILEDPQLSKCQISFAIYHFAVTFLALYTATRRPLRLFVPIRLPVGQMIPICLFFVGFLISNNYSLANNSIGFYQLAKILTTPAVVIISYLVYRQTISRSKLNAVLAMCLGVAFTNTAEVNSNPKGAALSIIAFTVTACYQVWIGKKLKDFGVTPAQLLLNQTPIAVVLLGMLAPFLDTVPNIATLSPRIICAVLASGLVASLINLSQFLIIGRNSALTFNIVSMLKMVSILSLGWYLEGKIPSAKEFSGVTLAFGGAWIYAQL